MASRKNQSPRYNLRRDRKPVLDRSAALVDMGINPEHVNATTARKAPQRQSKQSRLERVRQAERSRSLPYVQWVIAGVALHRSCTSQEAWQALQRGEVKASDLNAILCQVDALGMGRLTARELNVVIREGYTLPFSREHFATLPTDNGHISDRLARKLQRAS